jgi:hypothetical protein
VLAAVNRRSFQEHGGVLEGITRLNVTDKRITVRFPNGDRTHSTPRQVQVPEELQGVYLVPDLRSYASDYQGLLDQLRTWIAAGYRQESSPGGGEKVG